MSKMKNNLNTEILKYFLLFSAAILIFLWLFQFSLFNYFYKTQKENDIKVVSKKLKKSENKKDFETRLNNLAFDKSVCIEITDDTYDSLYNSIYFGKGCISNIERTYSYKFDFISNNYKSKTYELINPEFNNHTLVQATKLSNNRYAFINTSIEPIDGITFLIKKELIIITILVLILSYILAYFISNHIASPIKNINNSAKELAKGNFDIDFKNNTKILEIEELSNTLEYTKNELKKTEELRRDLMANVSHDLKTPLTMIKAYAEMSIDLHSNNLEKQKQDMEVITSETDRLTILVNDILTLSKLQSNIEELELQDFDLIKLIEDIIHKYSLLEELEHYKFEFNHKDKKLIVNADKKKIEQVIYNLINNAINYTGKDKLIIANVINNKNNIRVEIKDTGKGINKEDIPYIWDKYYKNEKKHQRNVIGTGLGLNIVKNILEKHNFKYGVESNTNGTIFYFEIEKK